uniref:Helicase C-terminal domain-containing protein n=1 Tax=Strongyloides papillosus TaxID=174720 RepID=A0A0N5C5Z2_STREA
MGLISVLFTTETFAVGLNKPARTVLFTRLSKYDGASSRLISPEKYIQMAGTAGRKGMDTKGIVVLMVRKNIGTNALEKMVKGKSDCVNSAFCPTYSMILNFSRSFSVEELLV